MSGLPKELEAVAEVVGRDAALDLAEALGGQNVYIPRPNTLCSQHPLVKAMGEVAATRLATRCTGEAFYVPKARRALVGRLAAQGRTSAEIAAALNLSVSAVRRYRRHQGTMVP